MKRIGIELSGIGASDRGRAIYLDQKSVDDKYIFEIISRNNVNLERYSGIIFFNRKSILVENYTGKKIFDFSDAILVPLRSYSLLDKLKFYVKTRPKVKRYIKKFDAVVCASQGQLDMINIFNIRKFLIPDRSFYHTKFQKNKNIARDKIRYVWDSQGHYFPYIADLIKNNLDFFRLEDVELIIVTDVINKYDKSNNREALERLNVNSVFHEWNEKTFTSLVASCDIGLAPRDKKCKHSNMVPANKLVNYAGLGLSSIAENIPSYKVFAEDPAINVVLCEVPDDWSRALKNSYKEIDRIRADAEQSHKSIVKNYSEEVLVRKWVDVLDAVFSEV